MTSRHTIFQICVVVPDVRKANAHWARILGLPEAPIEVIFPGGILHYTHGQPADCVDCQVAKYPLDAFVLELMQPGPSPWRDFLDRRGPGGSCSYVETADVLGLELSVHHQADHTQLMQALLSGEALPFDELA